jgi:hypothetical protein
MGRVVAGREEDDFGTYIGFEIDNEILGCNVCLNGPQYVLRYTEEERKNLNKHRLAARRAIEAEHPKHSSVRIEIPVP